jgi:hypothetical protein
MADTSLSCGGITLISGSQNHFQLSLSLLRGIVSRRGESPRSRADVSQYSQTSPSEPYPHKAGSARRHSGQVSSVARIFGSALGDLFPVSMQIPRPSDRRAGPRLSIELCWAYWPSGNQGIREARSTKPPRRFDPENALFSVATERGDDFTYPWKAGRSHLHKFINLRTEGMA